MDGLQAVAQGKLFDLEYSEHVTVPFVFAHLPAHQIRNEKPLGAEMRKSGETHFDRVEAPPCDESCTMFRAPILRRCRPFNALA